MHRSASRAFERQDVMGVRKTSKKAYELVLHSGLLGKRQKQAYHVLYECGPLTGNELSEKMGMYGQWKRCSELKKRGLAEEVGERKCSITGMNCITWDVTDLLPDRVLNAKQKKLWFGLFSTTKDHSHTLHRTRQAAQEYKMSNSVIGVIHEFNQVGR